MAVSTEMAIVIRGILFQRVEYAVGKDPAPQPVIIPINDTVDPRVKAQSFDVSPQAGGKVVAQSRRLCLVKQKAVIQVPQCVLGDPDFDHSLPTLDFTASQSRTCAAPSRALARRWSRISWSRGGSSDRSKRSLRSSQSASMICSFWAIGSVLTSSAVIPALYRHCGPEANPFLAERPCSVTHRQGSPNGIRTQPGRSLERFRHPCVS